MTSDPWVKMRKTLDRAQVDLSDYSDEFVAGFAAGFEHHESGVDNRGVPFGRQDPCGGFHQAGGEPWTPCGTCGQRRDTPPMKGPNDEAS